MQLADLQIDRARLAAQQFKEHGITFPLTVGEEISTSWAHLNAYPVKELVGWELPLEGIVNAAHAQGAVIQWNHPGYPGSDWDSTQQPKGLEGTGLDAWEHMPPRYDEWKQAGKLPSSPAPPIRTPARSTPPSARSSWRRRRTERISPQPFAVAT